jgi:archaellum component FlaF (FlaF/FlaG flagellin family)
MQMKRMMIRFLGFAAVLLIFAACYSSERPQQQRASEAKAYYLPASADVSRTEQETPVAVRKVSAATVQRKIVKNGQVTLVVRTYEPFFNGLQQQVEHIGGYISQVQVDRRYGNAASGSIVLRIPPEKVDMMVSWLREKGVMTSENIKADDISEQYYDLQARLDNARKFEARLLEMLKTQTGRLQDVVLVEEKLNQVRENIEELEGKLRYYDNLVALATITISIRVEDRYVPPALPTFGNRAARTWHSSVDALKSFLAESMLIIIAIAPWMVPFSVLAATIWFLVRRLRNLHRRRESAGDGTEETSIADRDKMP